MGRNLAKYGKRKCRMCKTILDLNADNFHRSKRRSPPFMQECKVCTKIISRKRWEKTHGSRERCDKCGHVFRKPLSSPTTRDL